ncbi:SDR family oxidoreductase [Rivibacter subsaxonicus]|uniref:SDR family oxidoreductase n=1 Tax=Rivibacter subsaxonicus TaxID=457575 RepID=UPI0030FEBA21
MSDNFSLEGRRILITGAGRGLGLAIAKAAAAAGAEIWLNGRDRDALEAAARGITGARTLPFDIADPAAVDAAFATLAELPGGLHGLVNNVGQRDRRPLDAFTLEEVRRLLDVNLVAPFDLARRAARLMDAGGRIVNISSIAGQIARDGDPVYTASKGGLDALTRALAAEFGARGITVNAIAPGFFATETNAAINADPRTHEWLSQRTSLGRAGAPHEVAGAAVFLLSQAASYITGHTLAVDGGYLAHF